MRSKQSGAIFVYLHTAMFSPANYGFIPHTLSEDGDPIDCMVISPTRRPETGLATIRRLCAGIDCRQDRGSADPSQARHDDEPIQRVLHFAANELEKKGIITPRDGSAAHVLRAYVARADSLHLAIFRVATSFPGPTEWQWGLTNRGERGVERAAGAYDPSLPKKPGLPLAVVSPHRYF
jgi:hypothetical protein